MLARTLLLSCLLALVGCKATDPAFLTDDGRLVRDISPLPYRIALSAFPESHDRDDSELGFQLTDGEVQRLFAAVLGSSTDTIEKLGLDQLKLEAQRAGIEVIPIPARKLDDAVRQAQEAKADLLIMPRFAESPQFAFDKRTKQLGSTLLWFFTWVGGLHVPDKRYDARAAFDFSIINPYDGTPLTTYTATSEKMHLTLWERNERGWHGGVFWSFIMPPYLALDSNERVRRTLSTLVCGRIAGRLCGYLKQEFAVRERELIGTLRAIQPRNQTDIAAGATGPAKPRSMTLIAEIVADHPLTDCSLYVNDSRDVHFEIREGEKLKPTMQVSGGLYRIHVTPRPITLDPGRNEIRIEYAVKGRYTSRTLVYWNGRP